jgi:hypothetical protein
MMLPPTSMEAGFGAIAAFVVGFLWYGPILGNRWCKAAGLKKPKKGKDCKPPMINMVMTFVGWLAASAVFGWLLAIIPHASPEFPFGLATVIWLAFMLPNKIACVLWSEHDKNLIWIDGGYNLAAMNAIALVYFLI